MMGAAVATIVAYVALFVGMWLNSRRVYPVPYQWRRVLTLTGAAGALTVFGYELHSLPVAIFFFFLFPPLPPLFFPPAPPRLAPPRPPPPPLTSFERGVRRCDRLAGRDLPG